MSTPFTILHLSDSHIGNPKHKHDIQEVLKPLLADLKKVVTTRDLHPSLVVFSGDLAFGEIPESPLTEQYEQARDWLKEVYDSIDCKMEKTPLLIVPGNHDINRNSIGEDQENWVDNLPKDPGYDELEKQMMSGKILWKRMLERQREWSSFLDSLNLPWELDLNLLLSTGRLKFNGLNIGVAGLNTSWACSGEQDQGRLWIGKYQAQKAWQALSGCDFKIAVTHHPTSWLNAAEQTWMEEKIQSHFHLHLHGHTHDQWVTEIEGHLRVAAGPCYEGSSRENSYSWIVLDFGKSLATLHLRDYSRKGVGGWKPMYIQGKTSDDGILEVKNLLDRNGSRADPGSRLNEAKVPPINEVESVAALIGVLEEYFSLRWEPGSFIEAPEPAVVYWPVRLRPATPIHATQTFVAAALQKKGAKVVLCLDDLGNTNGTTAEAFTLAVKRWFHHTGAIFENLRTVLFSELINGARSQTTWEMVRKWLAENQYRLDRILEVSKITSSGEDITLEQLLQRRPRRLLTPPLVWACLSYLLPDAPNSSVITLGGYDERTLWKTWRESIQSSGAKVGHLYAPVLQEPAATTSGQAVHMSKRNLAWDSREDIETALENDRLTGPDAQNWLAKGRMAEWCLRGSILLPSFVKGDQVEWQVENKVVTPSSEMKDLRDIVPSALSRDISKAVSRWIL
jgi:predicted MPP superfamily phosphohydrolase